MDRALALAREAGDHDDVPVGAVVVRGGEAVGEGANRRERDQDPTAHAEMVALREASAQLGTWRLEQCTLYVTLEPCTMCAGAIVLARVPRLVYGALDPKAGAVDSLFDLVREPRLNHRADVEGGVLADESGRLLRGFFQARRSRAPGADGILPGGSLREPPFDPGGVA